MLHCHHWPTGERLACVETLWHGAAHADSGALPYLPFCLQGPVAQLLTHQQAQQ
jgi:hypothetical protein